MRGAVPVPGMGDAWRCGCGGRVGFIRGHVHEGQLRKDALNQRIAQFAVTVRDYDEAIRFYVDVLGFELLEDTDRGGGKRWVRVRPRGGEAGAPAILLARAVTPEQTASIGNQTGGRVFIFIETDDFQRDYDRLTAHGVKFTGPPREEDFGRVAVFVDLYGNKWDLIEPRSAV